MCCRVLICVAVSCMRPHLCELHLCPWMAWVLLQRVAVCCSMLQWVVCSHLFVNDTCVLEWLSLKLLVVCIRVCVYLYMCVNMYVCIQHICVYTYMCARTVRIRVRVRAWVHACLTTQLGVCCAIQPWVYICRVTPTHTQSHTHKHAHKQTHTHARTHANTRTCTCARAYTLSLSLSLSLTHTHAHAYTHTCRWRCLMAHARCVDGSVSQPTYTCLWKAALGSIRIFFDLIKIRYTSTFIPCEYIDQNRKSLFWSERRLLALSTSILVCIYFDLIKIRYTGIFIPSVCTDQNWKSLFWSKSPFWSKYLFWSTSIWMSDLIYFLFYFWASFKFWNWCPSKQLIERKKGNRMTWCLHKIGG